MHKLAAGLHLSLVEPIIWGAMRPRRTRGERRNAPVSGRGGIQEGSEEQKMIGAPEKMKSDPITLF